MASPQEALNKATFLLNRYGVATDRVRAMPFTPLSDPANLFPAALGFDLMTRIRVRVRPKDATGAILDQVSMIEGIEHTVKAGEWQTIWRLSPTDATPVVMIFNDPNTTFGNAVFGY